MLEVINLSKEYSKFKILDDVTMKFYNNSLYIFYGSNGAGKSTILKILSGVIYKSKGTLISDEVISYLPDKFMLPKLMKVKSYLKLILNDEIEIDNIMKRYNIPNNFIGNLSKGNFQKVGLVQSLYLNATCYIFDEPLDGLDDFSKTLFKEDIINLLNKGKKVIMTLHDRNIYHDMNPECYEIRLGKCYAVKN